MSGYEGLLREFAEVCRAVFGEELVGVYLHGSLAMGCFNPRKSDLDLLVVTRGEPEAERRIQFLRETVRMNEKAPAKGLELSVVQARHVNPFVYPTPYDFHFSAGHLARALRDPAEYVQNLRGVDPDLAGHVVILRKYGRTLWGEEIENVFAPVPEAAYWDSIWRDAADASADAAAHSLYTTLNLCRVLAYARDGLILSKKAGGEWGSSHLPPHQAALAQTALRCYLSDQPMPPNAASQSFADYMIREIKAARERAVKERRFTDI